MGNKQPWYHEVIVSFDINEHFRRTLLRRIDQGMLEVLETTKGALKTHNEVAYSLDERHGKMEMQLLFTTTTGRVSEKAMIGKIKTSLAKERCIEQGSVVVQMGEPEPGDPADLM